MPKSKRKRKRIYREGQALRLAKGRYGPASRAGELGYGPSGAYFRTLGSINSFNTNSPALSLPSTRTAPVGSQPLGNLGAPDRSESRGSRR